MNSIWGINLQPLIIEFTKLSLAQQQIIVLLQQNNQSQTLTNTLLQEIKKLLENPK